MNPSLSPTKGNLINLKRSLSLAKLGYDLMDKKKNILLREMTPLIEVTKSIKAETDNAFKKAYKHLKMANMSLGFCGAISNNIKVEKGLSVTHKSVMGLLIPKVTLNSTVEKKNYGFLNTNSKFDMAYISFEKIKKLLVILSETETSLYLLKKEINKIKTRANALKNIIIPNILKNIKYIEDALEEKEREEFSRLKIIKETKI